MTDTVTPDKTEGEPLGGVIYRELLPQDEEDLIKLIIDYNIESETILPPFQHEMSAYKDLETSARERAKRYLTDPACITFVAEKGGKLRGYIEGAVFDRPGRVYQTEGYIEGLAVQPGHQGEGIGDRLIGMLETRFKEKNCTHITVDPHADNPRTMHFYEKHGFVPRLMRMSKKIKELPVQWHPKGV